MNIKTVGHNCIYNLSLVANLFFQNADDAQITSVANRLGDTLYAHTKITYNNKTHSSVFSAFCKADEDFLLVKRLTNVVCGMSLFLCARKFRRKILPWGTVTGIRPSKQIRTLLEEGKTDKEIFEYFKTFYAVSDKKLNLALEVAKNEEEIIKTNKPDEISLYVGIPFCPSRCLYCSFVSTDLSHSEKYLKPYIECLLKEIAHSASLLKKTPFKIKNLYFGGGTPTSVSAKQLEIIFAALYKYMDLSDLKEFCVEAGRPDTIDEQKLDVMKTFGVNRISINPQSMNDKTLKLIGRFHTSAQIENAFELSRKKGFSNINADVIAALPGETLDDFCHTLGEIEKYSPENITVHTMSIKRGSALHQSLSKYNLTDRKTAEMMLDYSFEFMKNTNRMPYYMYRQKNMMGNLENVGYSKPGYFSRYNINIMEEVQSILALGGGGSSKAVSKDMQRIERVFNFKSPIEYIRRFDEILKKKDEFFDLLEKLGTLK